MSDTLTATGPGALLHMLIAPWLTQCISMAARLGLADLLHERSRSVEELAGLTETHPPSLYRLLRVLTEAGLFAEDRPARRFALTAEGQQLRRDAPDSLHAWAILCGQPYHLSAWADAMHSLRTGEPSFDHAHGLSFFDYLGQHAPEGQNFDLAMRNLTGPSTPGIVSAYDWSDVRTVVDVGGGNGTLLGAILKAQPHLTGILFDESIVTDRALEQPFLRELIAEKRCRVSTGNFFDAVPAGADTYLMKYIIHDWSDEQALRILTNCRRAISADGRLLLVEHVLTPGSGPHFGALLDLEMLVLVTGKERTEEEFADLLGRAGFTLARVISTPVPTTVPTPLSVIEARPDA